MLLGDEEKETDLKVLGVIRFAVSGFEWLRRFCGFAVFGFEWQAVAELVEVRCFWGLKI